MTILGVRFGDYDLITVTSLFKSDQPVSTTVYFWKLFGEFVRNRSIPDRFVGFL